MSATSAEDADQAARPKTLHELVRAEALAGVSWPGPVGAGRCLAGRWTARANLSRILWDADPAVRVARIDKAFGFQ